jgi:uracil-DNA glycosylase
MLLWLRDMGADEVLADAAINRFAEVPPTPAPRAKPEPPKPVATAPSAKPHLPPDATIEDFHLKARAATSLAELAALLDQFEAHPLRRTASNLCFTGGAASARILVVSDRPRSEEDRSGKVFADKHEVLTERMLAAIGLRAEADNEHEQVALLSFIPWRPPGNRPPNELECRMIVPFAARAIQLLQPQLILSLGALPGQWLAGGADTIQKQRGRWLEIGDVPMIATFHPETLLKSPSSKRLAWHDLLALRERLESLP